MDLQHHIQQVQAEVGLGHLEEFVPRELAEEVIESLAPRIKLIAMMRDFNERLKALEDANK